MTTSHHVTQRSVRNDALLVHLLADIRRARAAYQECRARPDSSVSRVERARSVERLADAMESYADAASRAGVPLPYRYRDDLVLYRALNDRLPRGSGGAAGA